MEPVKINELQAFEFDSGQDLLNGPVGTWFIAPAHRVLPRRPTLARRSPSSSGHAHVVPDGTNYTLFHNLLTFS